MDKEFTKLFLSNLLITAMLIPEVILINALIYLIGDPILWIVIASLLFIIITYLMYLNSRPKKRGVKNVKDRH